VEVKIGVAETAREIVLTSTLSPDEVEALVSDALKNPQGTLTLVDEKGARYVVPSARVAYVEIGKADSRRVGFVHGD
jgi:3-hydroxyacyl-CoA dehydrogenase